MNTPRVTLGPHMLQQLNFQYQPHSCTNTEKRATRRSGTPGEPPPFRHRLADSLIEPYRPIMALLESIPGISKRVAEIFIAETGADMRQFPTAGHLASWAGTSPGSNESARHIKSAKIRPGTAISKEL